jgi:hypothetical protein
MSLSGLESNKVFKTGVSPAPAYYYVSASLDLSGAVENGTYYFNYDNNYEYASVRDYSNYVVVDENVIISEVVVYANNDVIEADGVSQLNFVIGGAAHPSVGGGVNVYWAAPAGSAPGVGNVFTLGELNAGSVHLFGHEGGHHPYDQPNANTYKFLAIQVDPNLEAPGSNKSKVLSRTEKRKLKLIGKTLPSGMKVVEEGKVTVVLKLYPKFQ